MMERAFSVMNNVFGKQQTTVLNDHFELTVMLRHNRGIRRGARNNTPDPEPVDLVGTSYKVADNEGRRPFPNSPIRWRWAGCGQ